jgi:hypothetical protein
MYYLFWCHESNQWIDIAVCPARQAKGVSECNKCRQKEDILEIRKYANRKVNGGTSGPKKLIKKIHSDEPESPVSEELEKRKLLKRKPTVVEEEEKPKPKMILHKINKDAEVIKKPLIKLHKRAEAST